MTYISRDQELWQILALAHGKQDQALAVVAPAGYGKSTLLDVAASEAEAQVIQLRCNPIETDWPLSATSSLLSALDEVHATNFRSVLNGMRSESQVFSLATTLVVQLAASPLPHTLVLIDDAEYMDVASQQVLGYLARRLPGTGLRMVMAVRELEDDAPLGGMATLNLDPLSMEASVELAKSLTPSTAQAAVLELIAQRSGGIPRAIKSLLTGMSDRELSGEDPLFQPFRPGDRLSVTVLEQLAHLSEGAQNVLKLLSSGPYLPVTQVNQLAESGPEYLEELIAEGLVLRSSGNLLIPSLAVRSTVYWNMDPARRLEAHTQVLTDVADADQGLKAWHASFLEPMETCADELLIAAVELVESDMLHAGIEFAEQALHHQQKSALPTLIKLVRALVLSAQFSLARRYIQMARGYQTHSVMLPELVNYLVLVDYFQYQSISIQTIVASADRFKKADPAGCANMLATAAACRMDRWELAEARLLIDKAAEMVGDGHGAVRAVREGYDLYQAALTGSPLPSPGRLNEVVGSMASMGTVLPTLLLARCLTLGERYAEARELLSVVLREGPAIAPLWTELALRLQFDTDVRLSRFSQARETCDVILARGFSDRFFLVDHNLAMVFLNVLKGDMTGSRSYLAAAQKLVEPGTSAVQEAQVIVWQGRLAVLDGDLQSAARHFEEARRLILPLRNPHLMRFYGEYFRVLIRLGDKELARELVSEFQDMNVTTPTTWGEVVLKRCEANLLEGQASLHAFLALLDAWPGPEYELDRGMTLRLYAMRLRELGQSETAKNVLQMSEEVFRKVGMPPNANSHDGALSEADQRRNVASLLASLNEKEVPVVQLVARGYKNQAIAHQLFVSVRTVEARLTNIYRKVGVKSRFDLVRMVQKSVETSPKEDQHAMN